MTDRTILLVDANEHDQYAFRLFLESEGFHILHACSEAETIRVVQGGHVMATFIDVSWADSRREECIITRLTGLAPEMPLILLCSLPPPRIYHLVEKYDKIVILEKPFSINEIRRILKEHIRL